MATAHINKLPQIARVPDAQGTAISTRPIEPNDLQEVMTFAQVAVRSGTFGLKNIEEAAFRILYGRELGMSVFQSIMGIDIIQGRPGLKAGTVASLIQRSGRYEYRVTEWDHLKCVIEFYDGGQVLGKSTFTIEDAKRAGVFKDGSNWSKYPKAMLFARAITQGARAYCPSIFFGPIYATEELQDGVEYIDTQIVETPAEPMPEPAAETKPAKKPAKKAEPAPAPDPEPVVDAPFDDAPQVESFADKVKKLDAWAERVAKRFDEKGQASFAHPGAVIEAIYGKFATMGLVAPGASNYRERTKAIAGIEEPWELILENLKAFAAELNAELEQPPEPGSEG